MGTPQPVERPPRARQAQPRCGIPARPASPRVLPRRRWRTAVRARAPHPAIARFPCGVRSSSGKLADTPMSRQTSRAAHAADLSLTERRNPRTADIDLASAAEIVDLMAAEDAR